MTVRGSAGSDGWLAGLVELPPDELRADDLRHFAVFAGPAPAVTIDASAGAFARAAVEALADGERVRLGGAISVTGAEGVARRPALVFAPSDPVRAGAANRALAAAGIPWRFGDAVRDETSVRGGTLEGTVVRLRYPLIPTDGAAVDTLATAGGSPWAVAGERYVLVASPMDPVATALPLTAHFLPWLEDVITRHLLADGGLVLRATPMERVLLPAGVDELIAADEHAVTVRTRTIAAPAGAGVYWMRRSGAVVGALVVNAEPSESDLSMLDEAGLAARISGGRSRVITTRDDAAGAAFAGVTRRPLAGVMLTLLVVLLLVEAFVAREPNRSRG
jgi:hypothetical protein